MQNETFKNLASNRLTGFFFVMGLLLLSAPVYAQSLDVSIQNQVDENGNILLALTLKNSGSRTIYRLHPMFHFHHSMSMMSKVMRLDPGQSILLENDKHPPVTLVGRYPLMAMVEYWTLPKNGIKKTIVATDSFFYKERLVSKIEGNLESVTDSGSSIIKVFLQNRSESLKNVRMKLLLPPGLKTTEFEKMMGFTIRGGEEKQFEVRVFRNENQGQDRFPVQLMVEYGEMLKHYSREIKGIVRFSPDWYSIKYMPHISALALMILFLLGYYYKIYNRQTS